MIERRLKQHDRDKGKNYIRIFLYCADKIYEDLAFCIKKDFESLNYLVQLHSSEHCNNNAYVFNILDSVRNCDYVVMLLSEKSFSSTENFLSDLMIIYREKRGSLLTILVEPQEKVILPSFISETQWIDMSNWSSKKNNPKWYKWKFSEIDNFLQYPDKDKFKTEIAILNEKLLEAINLPLEDDSFNKIVTNKLISRGPIISRIEKWLNSQDRNNLLWIKGFPGTGKSIVVAELILSPTITIYANHFCQKSELKIDGLKKIIIHISYQLAQNIPQYRSFILPELSKTILDYNIEQIFDILIITPLNRCIDGSHSNALIIIDGLEALSSKGENILAKLIGKKIQELPDWVKVLVTSRPEKEILNSIDGISQLSTINMIDFKDEADYSIRKYLRMELGNTKLQLTDSLIAKIVDKCNGMFLYAECFCNDVQNGIIKDENINSIPNGITEFYETEINRLVSNRHGLLSRMNKDDFKKLYLSPIFEELANVKNFIYSSTLRKNVGLKSIEFNFLIHCLSSFICFDNNEPDQKISLIYPDFGQWFIQKYNNLNHGHN